MIGSGRRAVKRRLVEMIRERCEDATITSYDPGRDLQRRHIFFTNTDGAVEYAVLAGSLIPRDDIFTVLCVCWVRNSPAGGTADDAADAAEEDCERLMQHVNAAVAESPDLEGLAGVIDCTLGTIAGPDAQPEQEGWVAAGAIEINVHYRMEL